LRSTPTIQKIGVAAMLFAMLGFAVFRLLRIDLPSRRKVVITYDSNLRDKIVKSTPETAANPFAEERFREIADQLRKVEDEMDRGDDQGSMTDLRSLTDSAGSFEDPDSGSPPVRYVFVENGVRSVEQAVRDGRKDEARRMLSSLLEQMDRQSAGR
jgi:hypothetical protein